MNNKEIIGVIIKKGLKKINEIKNVFKNETKLYNQIIKENQNLFWRSTYVKRGRKIYHYWYMYEWDPVKKRTVHKYIGKIKPNEEIPDPPENSLADLKYNEIKGTEDIILSIRDYKKYKEFFKNYEIQYIIKKEEITD